MTERKIIKQLAKKPKKLFLIDSLGAILTTLFLFVLLRKFQKYFGMPHIVLIFLSIIAVIFFIYSTACFLFLKDNWTPFIRIISLANLLYCMLTTGFLIKYYPVLTKIGLAYFLVEITIICVLVYIELNVATATKKS